MMVIRLLMAAIAALGGAPDTPIAQAKAGVNPVLTARIIVLAYRQPDVKEMLKRSWKVYADILFGKIRSQELSSEQFVRRFV